MIKSGGIRICGDDATPRKKKERAKVKNLGSGDFSRNSEGRRTIQDTRKACYSIYPQKLDVVGKSSSHLFLQAEIFFKLSYLFIISPLP